MDTCMTECSYFSYRPIYTMALGVVMDPSLEITHQTQAILMKVNHSCLLEETLMWCCIQKWCVFQCYRGLLIMCIPQPQFTYLPSLPLRVHTQSGRGSHPDCGVFSVHYHTNHREHPWVEGHEVGGTWGPGWPLLSVTKNNRLLPSLCSHLRLLPFWNPAFLNPQRLYSTITPPFSTPSPQIFYYHPLYSTVMPTYFPPSHSPSYHHHISSPSSHPHCLL